MNVSDELAKRLREVTPPAKRQEGNSAKKKYSQATKQKRKVARAKQQLTRELEKLRKLDEETNPVAKVVAPYIQSGDEEPVKQDEPDQDVVFRPNPGPQTRFLAATEKEVLYGGSAGGGKSYALLADPCRYVHEQSHRALILRRTNDELRELILKSQELFPRAFPGAKWSERKSAWTFPSGATIWLTYLEQDRDVHRYQGQSFTYIGVDELTQYPTPFAWNYLRSRLRTTKDSPIPTYMRATTNPGGPGHVWVKKMFIDPAPPGKAFDATDIDTGEIITYPKGHKKEGQPLFQRRFIPASLYDNPYLTEDGDYEAMLLSLPEVQRRQLLEGNWDIAEGAAFPEFNRNVHVVEPFDIPTDWRRFRAADYGYSSPSAVLWFALDPNYDILYVYRELYVKGLTAVDLAKQVMSCEVRDRVDYGVLDSSCWHQRGFVGPTLAEQMIQAGCRWRPADRAKGSRVAGKNEIHRRLQVDPVTEKPGLVFFSNCTNIIAQLPSVPLDKKNPEDVDTSSEDHLYDALRYGIMSRPRPRSIFDDWHSDTPLPSKGWQPEDPVFGY